MYYLESITKYLVVYNFLLSKTHLKYIWEWVTEKKIVGISSKLFAVDIYFVTILSKFESLTYQVVKNLMQMLVSMKKAKSLSKKTLKCFQCLVRQHMNHWPCMEELFKKFQNAIFRVSKILPMVQVNQF